MTAWHLKAVSKCVPPSSVPRQSPNSHSAKSRITSPGVCEEPASGELIMTNTLPPTAPFVGIDVAKDSLAVHVRPTGLSFQQANDEPGIQALVARLLALAPALIVLEASGGYQNPLVAALSVAALPVAVVNPRQARRFAEASGKLAKTDPLDAACLAHFAEAIRPQPRPLPDADTQALAALLARRQQLLHMRIAEQQRLATVSGSVRRDIQQHLGFLERHLRKVDKELKQTVQRSPVWREQDDLLQSVPGIGPQVGAGAFGRAARAGDVAQPQARRFGRPGTVQPRQWSPPRPASHLRRSFGGACGVVPGGRGGHAFQCSAGTLLPGSVGAGQSQEGGPGGVSATLADHPQCHAPRQQALGRKTCVAHLTFKTVTYSAALRHGGSLRKRCATAARKCLSRLSGSPSAMPA